MGEHIATNTATRIMSDLSDLMLLQQRLSPAFQSAGLQFARARNLGC